MEKFRRKMYVEEEGEERMCTLYSVFGKYGTHGTTEFFLFEEPKRNSIVKAIVCDSSYGYTKDNIRYANTTRIQIYDIAPNGFIYVNRF